MVLESYLKRQALGEKIIEEAPDKELQQVVVIPAFDETSVLLPLKALQKCMPTIGKVEVILVFNASENEERQVVEKNKNARLEAEEWYSNLKKPSYKLFFLEEHMLPNKHAGVGLARKIGMDEAVRRFLSIQNERGVIICFDADSSCDNTYLVEIEKHFSRHPNSSACSIYYEHPLEGNDFSAEVYKGILFYELHLRYYKLGLAYAGLPYAFHTIGSSMAVRVDAYCKEGGMNKRKAGEDFYFLQKFISLGNFSELNSTKVIPSPRPSHRVPFGTGRAIQEMLDDERKIYESYAWKNFEILKNSLQNVESWYDTVPKVNNQWLSFVKEEVFEQKLNEIRSQSTTRENFVKRFYQWFDAFQCLKFMHFLRDSYAKNEPLIYSVPKLMKACSFDVEKIVSSKALLWALRKIERTT